MVGFSDLSNELVLMIWNSVEVQDVYSFSTLSKKVYLLTHDLLREHCKLQQRLSTISNVGAKPGEPSVFGRVLKELLLNPRAARYPSVLRIERWRHRWVDPWPSQGGHSRGTMSESDLKLFKQASRDIIDFPEKQLENEWLAEIDKGNEEPLIALLLFILTNLREFQVDTEFGWMHYIFEALDIIANKKNSCSLTKLHSVNFKYTATHDDFVDFQCVKAFAVLPSVTSINSCIMGYDTNGLLPFSPSDTDTNVTNLSFKECLIDPKTMSEFLSTTRNLQSFFYSPSESANIPANFDPFWIRTALLAYARDTLKSLTILANGLESHFMGSLAKFTCLDFVETDLRLLTGDSSISIHKLSTVLPSSIVNIKLHNGSDAHYQASIQEIADDLIRFGRLQKITVVGVVDVRATKISHQSLISVLEGRGTRLRFATDNGPDVTERESDGGGQA